MRRTLAARHAMVLKSVAFMLEYYRRRKNSNSSSSSSAVNVDPNFLDPDAMEIDLSTQTQQSQNKRKSRRKDGNKEVSDEEAEREEIPEYAHPYANNAEVTFNLAKIFHHVSLFHIAVPLYEQVLKLEDIEDPHRIKLEAAHNLAHIYNTTGSPDLAHEVLTKYIVFD